MKNINLKPFWIILAGISVVVITISVYYRGFPKKTLDYFQLISTVVTINTIAYAIFSKWIWRFPLLQGWLVPFPNLNGTWIGTIQTNWKDDKGNKTKPIPVILTIRQQFDQISCVMRTKEMESHSYLEGFSIVKEEQIRYLGYSYTSKPKSILRDRSTPHDGTARLRIINNPVKRLEGEYWTQRQTIGEMSFDYYSNELLEIFPSDVLVRITRSSKG